MLVFPQLIGNAPAQFPVSTVRSYRTVRNVLEGASTIRYSDPGGRGRSWRLTLDGLEDSERVILEEFFRETEGRLRRFTFLDPVSNLLARSEEFLSPVWQKDPLLSLSTGQPDPLQGSAATLAANPAPTPQGVKQILPLPAWFHYCFSVFVQALAPTPVTLRFGGAGEVSRTVVAGAEWTRVQVAGSAGTSEETLTVEVKVPAGASVSIFGAQLEAQPYPSSYRRTGASSGVYSNARFLQDELVWRAIDRNVHATTVSITSS